MTRLRPLFLGLLATALAISPAGATAISPVGAAREVGPPFTLEIFPVDEPVLARQALPGQLVNFLLTVTDADPSAGPVHVTVRVTDDMARVRVKPEQLRAGTVGELIVIPRRIGKRRGEDRFLVEITAKRAGWVSRDWRTIHVLNDREMSLGEAREMLDRFIPWLESEHPELGITANTKFRATGVAPALIVSKYLFFTPKLEIGLLWHSGSWGADAWARLYVRHRKTEFAPSVAAQIDSYPANTPVREVDPPAQVMRTTYFEWGSGAPTR
jgi:hypothetical protein